MGLESKCAVGQLSGIFAGLATWRLGVLQHGLTVNFHGDLSSLDDDLLGPPFVILSRGLCDVDHVVETARLFPVAMSVIHLAFEAKFRKAFFLIFRMKINASIGPRIG